MKRTHKAALLGMAAAMCLLCGCSKDMTGMPYSEIQAYMAEHPNGKVKYTVTIDDTLVLTESSTTAHITSTSQLSPLLDYAEYLQQLQTIELSELTVDAGTMSALLTAFPDAHIRCKAISLLGKEYSSDTQTVDLSDLTDEDVAEVALGLSAFKQLKTVDLCKGDALSTVSLDTAAALQALCPHLTYHYRIELFGQVLSTDMEEVKYFRADIGDEGLVQFRKLLPMMHKLTYFCLDWCGTTDEAMAQLRDEYADRFKVVWRVWLSYYNFLTDTMKVWANYKVTDANSHVLNYCTELRYLDLGHNEFTHCEFVRYMPHLDVLILGDTNVSSLEPLRDCKELTFLEIFTTNVTDLSPLEDLKELEYLNISNLKIDDISPIYHLDNMIKVNSTMNHIPNEQVEQYKLLQPQCYATFLPYGDPTEFEWRKLYNGQLAPRYALLRWQIGYNRGDVSGYPYGHTTEEITYESTGITPPEVKSR